MRGDDDQQGSVFSYLSAEQRIPASHPLRAIRHMVEGALESLSADFDGLYARVGRPSVAPEKLLRALLLQVLYSIRSERLLMEQMNYNLLFRWFVGLSMDDAVWDVSVFTKNRERLIAGEVAQKVFAAVLRQAQHAQLLSDEHFTVDGTLLEAWANRRSFVPRQEPPKRGSGSDGRRLLRDKVESKTDPQARLYKRSRAAESKPSYLGHVCTENRNGLVVAAQVSESSTRAEREAAAEMIGKLPRRAGPVTLGADTGYQEEGFLHRLRAAAIVPHVAEYGPSRCPQRFGNYLRRNEREDPGYEVSQRKRKRVEQVFAWVKHSAGLAKVKMRGLQRVRALWFLAVTALNLRRMQKLMAIA
jgi:transposase